MDCQSYCSETPLNLMERHLVLAQPLLRLFVVGNLVGVPRAPEIHVVGADIAFLVRATETIHGAEEETEVVAAVGVASRYTR